MILIFHQLQCQVNMEFVFKLMNFSFNNRVNGQLIMKLKE